MNTNLSTKPLDTLTAELADFLHLGPDLDLPALDRVTLQRTRRDEGWRCTAHVDERDAAAAIEAVYVYANGAPVRIQTPYESKWQPSGWQVSLVARITVALVSIEVVANLDADAYAEAMAGDRRQLVAS